MDILFADDGTSLAAVRTSACLPEEPIMLAVVSGHGRLLNYFFVRGGRKARLLLSDGAWAGRLTTHWTDGRRQWQLTCVQPIEPAPAPDPVSETVPATTGEAAAGRR